MQCLIVEISDTLPDPFPSFRRRPESRAYKDFWTPASAGVTILGNVGYFCRLALAAVAAIMTCLPFLL